MIPYVIIIFIANIVMRSKYTVIQWYMLKALPQNRLVVHSTPVLYFRCSWISKQPWNLETHNSNTFKPGEKISL